VKEYLRAAAAVGAIWALLAALGYWNPATAAAVAFAAAALMLWRERTVAPVRRWRMLTGSAADAQLLGFYCVAESRAREALAVAGRIRKNQDAFRAEAALLLAAALNAQKRFGEAEEVLTASPRQGARVWAQLAHALAGQSRLAEAEGAAARAESEAGEKPGAPERAAILDAWANIRSRQGRMKEALECLSEWVKVLERSPDERMRESAWAARIKLGAAYTRARKADQASYLLEDCARRLASRKGHLYDATEALSHLCHAFAQQGRVEEAIEAGRKAAALRAVLLTPGDPLHGQVWIHLAIACAEGRRAEEAIRYLRRVEPMRDRLSAHEQAMFDYARGLAYECVGDDRTAESIYRETLAEVARLHGSSHPVALDSLMALSRVLRRGGRETEAAEFEGMQERIEEEIGNA
jgi:tetratricopeptide (TPR) repeat protein